VDQHIINCNLKADLIVQAERPDMETFAELLANGQRRLHLFATAGPKRGGWVRMGPELETDFDCRAYMGLWRTRDSWLLPVDDEIEFFRPKTPPKEMQAGYLYPNPNPTFPSQCTPVGSVFGPQRPGSNLSSNVVRLDGSYRVSPKRSRPSSTLVEARQQFASSLTNQPASMHMPAQQGLFAQAPGFGKSVAAQRFTAGSSGAPQAGAGLNGALPFGVHGPSAGLAGARTFAVFSPPSVGSNSSRSIGAFGPVFDPNGAHPFGAHRLGYFGHHDESANGYYGFPSTGAQGGPSSGLNSGSSAGYHGGSSTSIGNGPSTSSHGAPSQMFPGACSIGSFDVASALSTVQEFGGSPVVASDSLRGVDARTLPIGFPPPRAATNDEGQLDDGKNEALVFHRGRHNAKRRREDPGY
jgi:hypothetical protein